MEHELAFPKSKTHGFDQCSRLVYGLQKRKKFHKELAQKGGGGGVLPVLIVVTTEEHFIYKRSSKQNEISFSRITDW